MGKKISTYDTGDVINANENYFVQFRLTDGVDGSAVAVTDAPVILHIDGADTQVFSGSARTAISDTNLVKITLLQGDNTINDTTVASDNGYEDRRLVVDTFYSGGRHRQAFLYRIEYHQV